MQSTLVNLPTTTGAAAATLLFERDYAQGNHWLDFLHLIRQWPVYLAIQDPDALEEDYWCNLNDFRTTFTAKCAEMLGGVDVIVDTPSTRGYHRPYLSCFKKHYPKTYWLMLGKDQPPKPPVVVQGSSTILKQLATADMHRILIVDDVYATGATAGRIVDFLRTKSLPSDVEFFIVAPLRIPANMMQTNNADAIRAADLPSGE